MAADERAAFEKELDLLTKRVEALEKGGVTGQTADFLLRDLADGDMFTSSLDADADGREGSTYVWTPAQLRAVLGDADGRWAAEVFAIYRDGLKSP